MRCVFKSLCVILNREMELMMGECEHIDNKDLECADESVQENGDVQKDKTEKLSSEGENSNIGRLHACSSERL